uniref:Putative lipocalin n=1 Tax=Ixodes ricinus TaxID=34613 RepID=A0A6B0V2V5_IXORI
MRVVIAALLSASFIICTSAKVKKQKKKTPDTPVVTVGYLLYEPHVTTVTWQSRFNSSLREVHKQALRWLRGQIYFRLTLQTWSIEQVDSYMSSILDNLKKNHEEVNPFTALYYVGQQAKKITSPPDILCLVTQTPLTVYEGGFDSYHTLCEGVVPLILTYNPTNDTATGESLGFLIRDTLNINNYLTWYNKPEEEKRQRFENCRIQREFKQKH